ncbi:MAG: HNH endonuclease [Defluviitaleaceae bacterium]|nr:HNH endonuclease [Defluviitaleaceae bacterium]
MNTRPPIKTTIKKAVDHWSNQTTECGLSVDWSEADTHCWRCGCKQHLQRCHIIPHALGGRDEPTNIVLLCSRCHAEGPNVADPEIMWDWIRAYAVPLYETFWSIKGMQEYKFIYQKSVTAEIKDILNAAGMSDDFRQLDELIKVNLQAVQDEASVHFGQPYYNAATMAGRYRMMLKNIAKSFNVCFPLERPEEDSPASPWWLEVMRS